ncbi:1D-myo-inositol 2-acetamido-2-deoxy-alpha-D-glucopyranoside deacetylase [Corynebacterium capitovis DSM 44611]|uniref:N-acetyl-1-D-myo-inositol-2-amino-2-deoxy-alpha- D-glucopyranoside deacetylase n=1 Tax=Corynebacterium capitovis TaxID=131081 RepID=UPI00037B3FD0|nr:N-acetyl-1-D-myo-inositol-2-amino-2-deoxy-alpha-D-glucopyranoside deacetylase [Corynebacterium capitovis]WKD57893.1 1D-myo-inositol 2-acetamido-2-deoxy-alpha-D-glucopyranoside deacetylase [Corynebacterium capitovis DSM 44611]
MTQDLTGYRVIAVHAHPDDESISTGGALAHLARRGADVLVVTCTLGEEGEVIGPAWQGLVADRADQLGGYRIHELQRALSILGARGTFLGGAGCYRDSGMAGSRASRNPRAFVNGGAEAVDKLAAIFDAERPHLVLTYGPDGGYGHPDHIHAHDVTHAAAEKSPVPRILWAVRLREELEAALPSSAPDGWRLPDPGELDAVDTTDTWVDLDDAAWNAKVEAMRAHATQISIAQGPHAYALSNGITQAVTRREHYQWGAGLPVGPGADLLSGIER